MSSEQEKKGELVKIGALWRGETKTGDICYTGRMGDAMLLVFKNKFKEQDKQPDFIVYVAKPQKKDEPSQEACNDGSNNPNVLDGDIPF
jgi:hypothetical protein